jgi:DNA-binding transcriptional regulator GbsR (MarR family)
MTAKRRAATTAQQSDAKVARFIEGLGSALTEAGFPRLPARVFAALLADEDGMMTASELADTLQVSPASISGAVRYLAQVHMLHREREPGSRRDVFVVRDDAWRDAMVNSRRTYDPILRVIAEGVQVLGGEETRAGSRLATSVDFLQFLSAEMEAIAGRWEEHRRSLTS